MVNAAEAVSETIAYFASLDLIDADAAADPQTVLQRIDNYWGADPEDLFDSPQATDLVVLNSFDSFVTRVGLEGYGSGDDGYVRALTASAGLAGPAFELTSATEVWNDTDSIEVTFTVRSGTYTSEVKSKYFDSVILDAMNAAIQPEEPRRFFTNGDGYVAFLTSDVARQINHERGWSLLVPTAVVPSAAVPSAEVPGAEVSEAASDSDGKRWNPFRRKRRP